MEFWPIHHNPQIDSEQRAEHVRLQAQQMLKIHKKWLERRGWVLLRRGAGELVERCKRHRREIELAEAFINEHVND